MLTFHDNVQVTAKRDVRGLGKNWERSTPTRAVLPRLFTHCCSTSVAGKSLWELFLEQFDDLLVKILLLAAVISFVSI